MTKEELFANAKECVFGPKPHCAKALIGYNMAVMYYSPVLLDAEAILLDMRKPHSCFERTLQKAFRFSSDIACMAFPKETLDALQRCADNFQIRYEPLLAEYALKAA